MRHRRAALSPLLAVLMICSLCPAQTRTARPRDLRLYIRPADFDFQTLLGDPPADDSPQHRNEMATLLFLQNRRTAEEINRCRQEARRPAVWNFASVLGDNFTLTTHPLLGALAEEVRDNGEPVIEAAKRNWDRPRPYRVDPAIHPCVPLEHSASYPSGHATWGMLWGIVLSNIFPDQRDALMARGRQLGDDRYLAGIHYPSDVVAGQKLGAEIAKRLLANRNFRIELDSVRRECGQPAPQSEPLDQQAMAR